MPPVESLCQMKYSFFASLWEKRHDNDNQDQNYRSCTIITGDACACLKDILDRMPAILHPNTYDAWFDHNKHNTKRLKEIPN